MSDVLQTAHVSVTGIINGSATVRVHNTGTKSDRAPDINNFVTSGEMVDKLTDRFEDTTYYG